MAFHSYNHGIVTSGKGVVREAFKVAIGATGAVGAISQSRANLVSSVTRTGAGAYTVQLNKPYPPRLVFCKPAVAPAGATTAMFAVYVRNSYSASAGTFDIAVADADTPAATDPANGDELMVDLVFDRYTTA